MQHVRSNRDHALGASAALAGLLVALPTSAQESAALTGTVVDGVTRRPLPGVQITLSSQAQGEQATLTDGAGSYRLPVLRPGKYTVHFRSTGHRDAVRNITIRGGATVRLDHAILPTTIELKGEEIVVVGVAPAIDVGTTAVGVTVDHELTRRVPLTRPTGKFASSRSFEGGGLVAPGAWTDMYGVALNGATSPENEFQIDGLSVNDPAFGTLGTPLSVEFAEEVRVVTGGYAPAQGRAMGGILEMTTKSGANEVHGSTWFSITPGALEGPREVVRQDGTVLATSSRLGALHDVGADLGGPIVRNRLWFYVGAQAAFSLYRIERTVHELVLDPATGNALKDDEGFSLRRPVAPDQTTRRYVAAERAFQLIGKLTYLLRPEHRLTLTALATPASSGGDGIFGFNNTGVPEVGGDRPMAGTYGAWAHRYIAEGRDLALAYSGSWDEARHLVDFSVGWHHQRTATLPSDGSEIGSARGLAGQAHEILRRRGERSLSDLEPVPPGYCEPIVVPPGPDMDAQRVSPCPASPYYRGGPGSLSDAAIDSYQARGVFTSHGELAGRHVLKVGAELKYMSYDLLRGMSGGTSIRESTSGATQREVRYSAFLQAPDQPSARWGSLRARTSSSVASGFLQDSWQPLDGLTLNAGVRYDAQVLYQPYGSVGLALLNQWSPRVGVIYDPTRQGRLRLFASYARYFEEVPLTLADRAFSRDTNLDSDHDTTRCDPLKREERHVCADDASRVATPDAYDPNRHWKTSAPSSPVVDPEIEAQSSDEVVVGAEYEPFAGAVLGATYTHRSLHRAIEDMSRDERASSFIIGNPGHGVAADFPEATRNYDALAVFLEKRLSSRWLARASYTLSYLRGNLSGLFRPESGQLAPNVNSDFDIYSSLANREGPLPGDHTHELKAFTAVDVPLARGADLSLGLAFSSRSGAPLSYLGRHSFYGTREVFILPRGIAGRGDWVHSLDVRLGYSVALASKSTVTAFVDIFNLLNFQAVTRRDESYTDTSVLPLQPEPGGGELTEDDLPRLKNADETLSDFDPNNRNPNFRDPLGYQEPRQVRLGMKVVF
ncbi:TonB-dependent receptor domain-containing protein [Sorangium sp. So ce1389]|uniref:TonB-dependent receptor n=1 Tax=Sorangium sp. So ce1389 TaxID=3133336 RepID=UPI003F5EAAAD